MKILFFLMSCLISSAKLITLNNENTVILRGPVDENSVSSVITNLNKLDEHKINLYINSPGGSVHHGNVLIEEIRGLQASGKKINCIADFAASMAFIILQSCSNRYALNSSVLMQHQMSLVLGGPINNVNTYLEYINELSISLNTMQADRIGMDLEEFKKKTDDDWWISGYKAKSYNIVDEIINVNCDRSLLKKTYSISVDFLGNEFIITFSKCPLISKPLNTKISNNLTYYMKTSAINELLQGKKLSYI